MSLLLLLILLVLLFGGLGVAWHLFWVLAAIVLVVIVVRAVMGSGTRL